MDQTTLEIIEKIEAGDKKEAQDFFKPLITVLFPYVELYLPKEDDVMECVKAAINEGHKNVASAKEADTPEAWIKSIALKQIIGRITPVAVRRGSGSYDPEKRNVPEDLDECRKELLKQLEPLDQCERAAIVLNQYEHKSVTQTADIMKTDAEIVDTLLRHGRSRLDGLYLFELIEKLNPRSTNWDTMEIDQYLPKRDVKTDTYEFTTSIRSLDDTFIQETRSMKPISSRAHRTYEESEERGSTFVIYILTILIIFAVLGLVWFVIRYLLR